MTRSPSLLSITPCDALGQLCDSHEKSHRQIGGDDRTVRDQHVSEHVVGHRRDELIRADAHRDASETIVGLPSPRFTQRIVVSCTTIPRYAYISYI